MTRPIPPGQKDGRRALPPTVVLLLLLGLLSFTMTRETHAAQADTLKKPGWALTFHDEFAGTQLDGSKWDDHCWSGRTHSNDELEYSFPLAQRPAGAWALEAAEAGLSNTSRW